GVGRRICTGVGAAPPGPAGPGGRGAGSADRPTRLGDGPRLRDVGGRDRRPGGDRTDLGGPAATVGRTPDGGRGGGGRGRRAGGGGAGAGHLLRLPGGGRRAREPGGDPGAGSGPAAGAGRVVAGAVVAGGGRSDGPDGRPGPVVVVGGGPVGERVAGGRSGGAGRRGRGAAGARRDRRRGAVDVLGTRARYEGGGICRVRRGVAGGVVGLTAGGG